MASPLAILDPLTSVQAFGAAGNALTVTDGSMSTGSATLTCAKSKPFKASDVGKSIAVAGAAAAVVNWPQVPVALVTTIASWVSPSQVTLAVSNASGGDVSGAAVNWGTDDSTAFQTALNALAGTGRALYIPAARYLLAHALAVPSNVTIVGSAGAYL